uniref:pectinesterase inhibitor 7-like n=1 Tax=Erigeron canadensis TaxID=72917 RepID=UPI001CB91B27|nr:pectinesterase inhibitor 7-like [Erigeron canadensis]
MKIQLPYMFFSFFFLMSTTTLLALTTAAGNSFPPTSNDTDFIRTSCQTTLYPRLCFTSLSGYSSAVQQNPARLARVAIGVTLSKANHMARYVSNISRSTDYDNPRVAAAIHDCHSVFEDAVDEIRGSLKQMRRLGGSGESLRFQLSNVQTWMSAALTNEDTCTDGFEDMPDDEVKADVCNRAVKVKEVTSNALALVNSFANTIQTP